MKAYCETMFARAIEGRLNGQDELPLLQVAVVLVDMDAQASAPHSYQRATLPLLATLGRWRGYRVVS
jgi:hypothetical protein